MTEVEILRSDLRSYLASARRAAAAALSEPLDVVIDRLKQIAADLHAADRHAELLEAATIERANPTHAQAIAARQADVACDVVSSFAHSLLCDNRLDRNQRHRLEDIAREAQEARRRIGQLAGLVPPVLPAEMRCCDGECRCNETSFAEDMLAVPEGREALAAAALEHAVGEVG
jgi:hypothetical protein